MNPHTLRKIHWWLAILWMFPGVPVAWWITYKLDEPHAAFAILLVSLWANTASHLGAMGAARAEESSK